MQFLVIGLDGDDSEAQARRSAVRDKHLALGDAMEADDSRWYGASIRDQENKMIGSFAVMDFPSRDELDDWLSREPYVVAGVWREIQVHKCAVRNPWKFNRPRRFFEKRETKNVSAGTLSPVEIATAAASEVTEVIERLQDEQLQEAADAIINANRVFVAGGGRSGLIARAVAMRLAHVGLKVYVVGETNTPGIDEDDLFLAFSARGTGKALNTQARGAKELKAKVLTFTTNAKSELGKLSDALVYVPIGQTEVTSTQHAGTLFEQCCLLVGDALAASIQKQLDVSDQEMTARHFNLY